MIVDNSIRVLSFTIVQYLFALQGLLERRKVLMELTLLFTIYRNSLLSLTLTSGLVDNSPLSENHNTIKQKPKKIVLITWYIYTRVWKKAIEFRLENSKRCGLNIDSIFQLNTIDGGLCKGLQLYVEFIVTPPPPPCANSFMSNTITCTTNKYPCWLFFA